MAILLTGGTGKTSIRLARILSDAKIPFLLASRKAVSTPDMPAVSFNWNDASTYDNPFQYKFPNGEKLNAVYIIAPEVPDPVPPMNAFVDFVHKEGVNRFVLMTGSLVHKGGDYVGPVWSHFEEVGVEYTVLLATWFMENFTEGQHRTSIRTEIKFYTTCGDGKVPFISAQDIAATAFQALTSEKPLPEERYRILGPELLTHDQIADKLSSGLSRKIEHVKLSEDDMIKRNEEKGNPPHYARLLVWLEAQCALGVEERTSDAVEKLTGHVPLNFDTFVKENKAIWQ